MTIQRPNIYMYIFIYVYTYLYERKQPKLKLYKTINMGQHSLHFFYGAIYSVRYTRIRAEEPEASSVSTPSNSPSNMHAIYAVCHSRAIQNRLSYYSRAFPPRSPPVFVLLPLVLPTPYFSTHLCQVLQLQKQK